MSKKKKKLEELNPTQLEQVINNSEVIFLPLGTLEWHQQHLPFGVDAYISNEICHRVSDQIGGCVIPPLFFGTDREHKMDKKLFHGMDAKAGRILPGNFYFLKESFFFQLLSSIIDNIEEQGVKKLVIVSAHSGTAQQRVIEKIKKDNKRKLKIWVFPGKSFEGGIDHAGRIETSYMLSIKPDLVDITKLNEPPFEAMIGDNPKEASKEEGDRRFQQTANAIIDELQTK